MIIYTASGFRASAAKAGTDQAKTRPLTLTGVGETVKYSPTDAQFAAWANEPDAGKRAAILAECKSRVMTTGKAQVTTAARDSWIARLTAEVAAVNEANAAAHAEIVAALPKGETAPDAPERVTRAEYAKRVLSSGVVVLDNEADDDTDEVIDGLFPEED